MRYTRIFSDADGESHLEDVDVVTQPTFIVDGMPLLNLSSLVATLGVVFVHIPSDVRDTDWHVAPRRQFIVLLAGEGQVEVSDGEVRRFVTGDVVLAEDTAGKGHVTTVLGTEDSYWMFIPLAPGDIELDRGVDGRMRHLGRIAEA